MATPVAIVTGAGRGIGRACAVDLAKRGWRLALASRSADELEETASLAAGVFPAAEAAPTAAIVVRTDVADPQQVEELIGRTVRELGRIDAIVDCAGVAPVVTVEAMTPDHWRAVLDTNLSSAFYLAHSAWPTFKAQRGGVIVQISSLAARDPFAGFAAYSAAKAGLHLLGLCMAREGREIGVRVHTLALGAVETAMLRKIVTPVEYPPEKTLSPEDVAQMVWRCVSGELKHTSGEVIWMQK